MMQFLSQKKIGEVKALGRTCAAPGGKVVAVADADLEQHVRTTENHIEHFQLTPEERQQGHPNLEPPDVCEVRA